MAKEEQKNLELRKKMIIKCLYILLYGLIVLGIIGGFICWQQFHIVWNILNISCPIFAVLLIVIIIIIFIIIYLEKDIWKELKLQKQKTVLTDSIIKVIYAMLVIMFAGIAVTTWAKSEPGGANDFLAIISIMIAAIATVGNLLFTSIAIDGFSELLNDPPRLVLTSITFNTAEAKNQGDISCAVLEYKNASAIPIINFDIKYSGKKKVEFLAKLPEQKDKFVDAQEQFLHNVTEWNSLIQIRMKITMDIHFPYRMKQKAVYILEKDKENDLKFNTICKEFKFYYKSVKKTR